MSILFSKLYELVRYCLKYPLSLLRITLSVLFGKYVYGSLYYDAFLEYDTNYIYGKTWFLELLPSSLFDLSPEQFATLKLVLVISIICSIIGLFGRLNLLILAFFGYLAFGLVEVAGAFDHHLSLPTQVMLALALVPGSMKISLDALILRFFRKNNINSSNQVPKWGFNLILALVVITYFTAGVSKIRYGGLKWVDGTTLGFYLKERTEKEKKGESQLIIGDHKIKDEDKWKDRFGFIAHTYGNFQNVKKWNERADYIANNRYLVIALAIGSVMFELLAFIAFFNSKYRNIYLVSAILFHMSIGQLMGISFRQYRLICFFLIDWNLIIDTIINKLKTKKLIPENFGKLAS